jgi:hypothetical protein
MTPENGLCSFLPKRNDLRYLRVKKEQSPENADAFVDFPPARKECPNHLPDGRLCARCHGFGGWNLELNAYPKTKEQEDAIRDNLRRCPVTNLPGPDMTNAEFRHHYVHFRASCSNCNGWGWVKKEQGDHVHEWVESRNVGKCLNEYTCKTCGERQTVDSSD